MSDSTPGNLPLPIEKWEPYTLPELATNGFPFAPTFIVKKNNPELEIQPVPTNPVLPFGFHFRTQPCTTDRPVIDLTKGYYDPHTQKYTIPLRAGGDTEGGTFESGYWTPTGDGQKPGSERKWDSVTDYETD